MRIRERKTKVTLHQRDRSKEVQKVCHQLIRRKFKSLGGKLGEKGGLVREGGNDEMVGRWA